MQMKTTDLNLDQTRGFILDTANRELTVREFDGTNVSNFTRSTEVIPIENLNVLSQMAGISSGHSGWFYSRYSQYRRCNVREFHRIGDYKWCWGNHGHSIGSNDLQRPMELVIGFDMFICNDLQIQWSVGMRKPTRTEPWTRCPSICMCSMVPVVPTRDWAVGWRGIDPTDLEHVSGAKSERRVSKEATVALVESIGSRNDVTDTAISSAGD